MPEAYCTNRKANHDFEILSKLEVGIILLGTEVKSIRASKVTLAGSYIRRENDGVYLIGCDIAPYDNAGAAYHDPLRKRKLLMHGREIEKIFASSEQKGLTVIPLKIYPKKRLIKMEIALARGRKSYDKREAIKKREASREMNG